MSLEIVAGLLGSQLVRAVASEVATTLACQAIQHAVGSMARPVAATAAAVTNPAAGTNPGADLSATSTFVQPAASAGETAAPELRALPTVEVLSAIPGRARLRIRGIRDDAERAAEVVATIRALDGVTVAEANPLTGGVLVRFDANQTDVTEIVAVLESPRPNRPLRASERAPYLRLLASNE